MSDKRCDECLYYDKGLCHRFPPQCASVVPQKNAITGEVVPSIISGLPQTNPDWWCGEHRQNTRIKLAS